MDDSAALPAPVSDDPPPVRGWVLLVAPVVSIIGLIVIAVVAGVALMIAHQPPIHGDEAGTFLQKTLTKPETAIGLGIVQYIVLLFFLWLFVPKRGARSLAPYFRPVPMGTLGLIALGALAFGAALAGLQWALDHFDLIKFPPHPEEELFAPHTLPQLALMLVLGSVLAPLAEELYFRGLLLGWLRAKLPLIAAAAINAVLFSLVHGYFAIHAGPDGWLETGEIVVVGFVLVALMVRTGSLWASITFHAVYNGAAIILAYVATRTGF